MTASNVTSAQVVDSERFESGKADEFASPIDSPSSSPATGDEADPFSRIRSIPAADVPEPVLQDLPLEFPGKYQELELSYEREIATVWMELNPSEAASFTPALLWNQHLADCAIRKEAHSTRPESDKPEYFVMCSSLKGIFNLGGDLRLIHTAIENGDRAGLMHYATACINNLYTNRVGMNSRLITFSLVEGDALGGGFEAALSTDAIIAEAGTKFGFPEVLFNLFPGMGALSILGRRLGPDKADEMARSGAIYTAEELHELGIVQMVAPKGEGREALRDYIRRNRSRHNAHYSINAARRGISSLSYGELHSVIEIWVEAAFNLEPVDLRRIRRLLRAQDKRRGFKPPRIVSDRGPAVLSEA